MKATSINRSRVNPSRRTRLPPVARSDHSHPGTACPKPDWGVTRTHRPNPTRPRAERRRAAVLGRHRAAIAEFADELCGMPGITACVNGRESQRYPPYSALVRNENPHYPPGSATDDRKSTFKVISEDRPQSWDISDVWTPSRTQGLRIGAVANPAESARYQKSDAFVNHCPKFAQNHRKRAGVRLPDRSERPNTGFFLPRTRDAP